MSNLEKLSDSEKLILLTSKDAQRELLTKINENLTNNTFTEETLKCIGNLVIDGMKLKEIFDMHIEAGRLVKKNGLIMFCRDDSNEEE